MKLDEKLTARMKRFQVIPADDGSVTIHDAEFDKDIATFEGPDADKCAGLMYRDLLGIGNAGVTS